MEDLVFQDREIRHSFLSKGKKEETVKNFNEENDHPNQDFILNH